MASRPARRTRPALAVLAGVVLLAGVAVLAVTLLPAFREPVCTALGAAGLPQVTSCAGVGETRAALAAGRQAAQRKAFREALGHYRAAVTIAPEHAGAQVARGEVAEILGEYGEALEAFQRAAVVTPGNGVRLRIGATADRLGRTEVALQALEGAQGPWRQHAAAGGHAAALRLAGCVPIHWASPGSLWSTCVGGARATYDTYFEASRESVPRWIFRMLVEDGKRDRALAYARERGWVHSDVEYCGRHSLPLDPETSVLLAVLTQPDRADCALAVAARVADEGGARLGRLLLVDRIEHSSRGEIREQAQHVLRYRLPDHDVPRLAEALNATGWRLQNVHDNPDEALVVFGRAVEADPRFSWPLHNIGRVYMARRDYEQARVWLERTLAVNPDHWRALYNYGVTNAHLKRWPEALAAYRRAVSISPSDARLHANIGWTLLKLGQEAEAEQSLQTALRLDPGLKAERNYFNARYGRDARGGPTPFSTR
jgi:tetratricopeptide (TPR) repeat protein